MKIEVRPSVESDVQALKDRLREADAQEVIAEGNASVEDCLAQSLARSVQSFTVGLDGVPVAMFGIVPDSLIGVSARVWFLGTPEMARIKKSFVRQSIKFIYQFLDSYPFLWNYVDARYKATIRWLETVGAIFPAYVVHGPNGDAFRPFFITRGF